MNVRMTSVVKHDSVTGLIIPQGGAKMKLANGDVTEVPPDFFMHPQTGRVLPIHGNIAYDILSSKLVFTIDSATGKQIYWNSVYSVSVIQYCLVPAIL